MSVRQDRQRRDAAAAGENQLGRCSARQKKMYWFYLHSGKLALAVMYLRPVRVDGRSFAAVPAHVSAAATPSLRLRTKLRRRPPALGEDEFRYA
jgi:hypothetical protein